ncbi:class I adenylate cyclase [Desulfurivibrio dismutans]|uniref:class I adenylate cyclase n=1 Tax=Desulfurivibrio dismutans TaxID=1398908 RepID=UPI0023D9E83D|nr:class I adenylate cyclase [Desulfurivibrio alkaliphilus]MDF1615554.1 class I adenylate cyclase [Desulfurivibrio alkaliphilus]
MGLKEKIARYRRYNEERIAKSVLLNPHKSNIIFAAVPYLLHVNHPDLPGYICDPGAPGGICNYDPAAAFSFELFHRFFPGQSVPRGEEKVQPGNLCAVRSLMTIGSVGTIGQSDKSDCDYWVSVHRSQLGDKGMELMAEKCAAIEAWTAKKGVETHFFLMDIEETRENRFASAAEEESAGTSLKILLKDELFRTHVLVAGKPLLWWFMPPGLEEAQYHGLVKRLVRERKINPDDYVDLGCVASIPKEEIFGACLWQMNKALDSPFKSVIKFAYLELLLQQRQSSPALFSDKIKRLVTYPEKLPNRMEMLDLGEIDPYLLLAREIIAFYQQAEEQLMRQWADLIRECLFLKTLEMVESQKQAKLGEKSHHQAIMTQMEAWDIMPANRQHFLNFRYWQYRDLLTFGTRVHGYLAETYKRLRRVFKEIDPEVGLTISERDIATLGRKLFTFYETKPHKIDYIRSVSRYHMAMEDITIHITKYEERFFYYAFQGELAHYTIREQVGAAIRRDDHLIRLITWLMVNGILARHTKLHLTKNFLPIDLADIQILTDKMLDTFPLVDFSKIPPQHLVEQENILRALVVVNFFKEPVKGSKTLPSTIISENSYGEYFLHDYNTLAQLKNALLTLLTRHYVSRWNNNLTVFIPSQDEISTIKTMLEKG